MAMVEYPAKWQNSTLHCYVQNSSKGHPISISMGIQSSLPNGKDDRGV
jgi:hypothetical protein